MQFDVGVELGYSEQVRDHTSMEPEVGMMIVPRHLDNDFVSISHNDAEKLLPIDVIVCISPLRLQPPFEFHAEIDVTSEDEFSIRLRIPELLLDPF